MEPDYQDVRQMLLNRMSDMPQAGSPQPVLNQMTAGAPAQTPPTIPVSDSQRNLGRQARKPATNVQKSIKSIIDASADLDTDTKTVSKLLVDRLLNYL